MKKLILLSILLIVGCAPTTATFYIGMSIEEFAVKNPHICNNIDKYDTGFDNDTFVIEKDVGIKYFSDYFFKFNDDTLQFVYRGILNSALQKEIDYDKYATPPE